VPRCALSHWSTKLRTTIGTPLDTYSHVAEGIQRDAGERVASLLFGAGTNA